MYIILMHYLICLIGSTGGKNDEAAVADVDRNYSFLSQTLKEKIMLNYFQIGSKVFHLTVVTPSCPCFFSLFLSLSMSVALSSSGRSDMPELQLNSE